MDKDLEKEIVEERTISELEEKAIIKYEEKTKPYRQAKYKQVSQPIVCQKCGSRYSLMKTTTPDGKEFWFCKSCVMERARELNREGRL